MKRHHKIAIIAIICGYLLAYLFKAFFGEWETRQSHKRHSHASIVAVATLILKKNPRPDGPLELGVLALLLLPCESWLYIAPHGYHHAKNSGANSKRQRPVQTDQRQVTVHQEMIDLLRHF